jgi:acyl-CoA reductase-like NAD-dependent aldehyde dehydrogenase
VSYETVNPATGEFVDRFATISDRDLDRVVDMAQAAFIDWRRRNAAPQLAVGNVLLLKHAESVPQSALAFARLLEAAGLPGGSIRTCLRASSRSPV